MKVNIPNEWGRLEAVVVGHGRSMPPQPTVDSAFDPTSKWHLAQGTYPHHEEVAAQLDGLADTLSNAGVEVLRPVDIPELEQVFARDVGMVIDSTFIRSRTIEERQGEWKGVAPLFEDVAWSQLPDDVQLEGGDVIVLDDALAVGVTHRSEWTSLQAARTLPPALSYLAEAFPDRDIIGIELHKDDQDPLKCALHLDCAYMPLGGGEAIVCPEAFVEEAQFNALMSRHSKHAIISLSEAAVLQSNLLSLTPDTVLIDPQFIRLGTMLEDWGYTLVECPMDKVGRMGGLFRCSTLPLRRS